MSDNSYFDIIPIELIGIIYNHLYRFHRKLDNHFSSINIDNFSMVISRNIEFKELIQTNYSKLYKNIMILEDEIDNWKELYIDILKNNNDQNVELEKFNRFSYTKLSDEHPIYIKLLFLKYYPDLYKSLNETYNLSTDTWRSILSILIIDIKKEHNKINLSCVVGTWSLKINLDELVSNSNLEDILDSVF